MRRVASSVGKIVVGVVSGIGLYVLCVVVVFVLGGLTYSVTLGALLGGLVSMVIAGYFLVRKRESAPWQIIGGLVAFSSLLAVFAVLDSPSVAFMWLR